MTVLEGGNDYYRIFIRDDDEDNCGTFSIGAGSAHTNPGENIFYGAYAPANTPFSSYITVRSYTTGTDYVSRDNTTVGGSAISDFDIVELQTFSKTVSAITGGFRTTWTVTSPDELTIVQDVVVTGSSMADAKVRVSVTVTNNNESEVQIGIRYLWDFMIDGTDDSLFRTLGPVGNWTLNFTEFTDPSFFGYSVTNNSSSSIFTIYGTVDENSDFDPLPTIPNTLYFAYWQDAYVATWDMTVEGSDDDSAVVYFFGDDTASAFTLAQDESQSVHEYLATLPDPLGFEEDPVLVTYVPFDEADGRHFTERVNSARGYFHPQEPYVNDSNELVFTGYNCMALPSLRATFETGTTYLTDTKSTDAKYLSEDGAYSGGILWDRGLLLSTAGSDPDYTEVVRKMNVWKGVAQLRIRLRQLKEGVLCGRLGIIWDLAEEQYSLCFVNNSSGASSRVYYGGVVDESWIGVEKTITVFWDGTLGTDDACDIWVDTTDLSVTPSSTMTWNDETSPIDGTYKIITDLSDDDSEAIDGALGGNPTTDEFCVAFDCIFFRQWWDDFQYGSQATFVANTYDTADLPEELTMMHRGLTAKFNGGDYVDFDGLDNWPYDVHSNRGFITLPFTKDMASANGGLFGIYSDTDIVKTDIIVKRIVEWESGGDNATILTTGDYEVKTDYASWATVNGCDISNLVNNYNYKTFRDHRRARTIFYETNATQSAGGPGNFYYQHKSCNIFETVEDLSPLHGCEYIGGDASQGYLGYYHNKTRYLILCHGTRWLSLFGQRSYQARWCTGPISYAATDTDMPVIRAISRYRSEDGKVDKLFVVAGCSAYEIDATTGALTSQNYGWLSGTSVSSVTQANNKMLLMDPVVGGIKINGLGNWSRVGIERPAELRIYQLGSVESTGVFDLGTQWAWVAQYYDSENDAYSGTVPVIKEQFQTLLIKDTSDLPATVVRLYLGACRDRNVDGFRVVRTQDLKTPGNEEVDLFLVCDSRNTNEYLRSRISDTEEVANLVQNPKLGSIYFGQDMVPLPSPAMASAFNRVWTAGNSDAKSLLRYSLVDSIGFAKVDEYPETNAMIIEEGGTAACTALVEYGGLLHVFKDNAIFRVSWDGLSFYSELIYKGVGALNQRCVTVAGSAIFFLDTNGLYVFQGSEPVMLSVPLLELFKTGLSSTYIDRSFLLYSKEDESILAFVPSTYSTGWCDLCVIYSMRTQTFTVDAVPPCSCGFVDLDDNQIYLGTSYGAVLKYTRSTYLDQASAHVSTTGDIDSDGDISGVSETLDTTGRLHGTYVYAVDETNHQIWRGVIASNTASTISVEGWIPTFNATDDPLGTGFSLFIGHVLLWDKTAALSFDAGEEPYEKNLVEVEYLANDFSASDVTLNLVSLNEGAKTTTAALSSTTVRAKRDVTNGAHRLFHVELAALVDAAFRVRNAAYFVVHSRGRLYDA